MKKVVLHSRDRDGDWSDWRVVWLLKEHNNTWKIWSWHWEEIFTRYVHKKALGEKIVEL